MKKSNIDTFLQRSESAENSLKSLCERTLWSCLFEKYFLVGKTG